MKLGNCYRSIVDSYMRKRCIEFALTINHAPSTTQHRGFTLLETLVAVSLLAIAIVAPMSLTTQSLESAYYARDQITAFYLAQEALEAVRNVRDNNILQNSQNVKVDLLNGFPSTGGAPFRIDTRNNVMTLCSADPGGACIPLQTDGTLYGYGNGANVSTIFTRTVTAAFIPDTTDEIKLTVTITWQSGGLQKRTVTISENLYRWVNDGAAL